MKIGVTYESGQVFQHFGRSQQFKIYDVADGELTGAAVIDASGNGHGALAGFLKGAGVDILICGGIGGGAQTALAQAGIRVYGGITGEADQAVADLLVGSLVYNPDIQCGFHGVHGHGGHNDEGNR